MATRDSKWRDLEFSSKYGPRTIWKTIIFCVVMYGFVLFSLRYIKSIETTILILTNVVIILMVTVIQNNLMFRKLNDRISDLEEKLEKK